jgi:ADP-ribose pyrophosphatase YjhB (NUDIX family)
MELGETLEEVTSRELREETGLIANQFERGKLLSNREEIFRGHM